MAKRTTHQALKRLLSQEDHLLIWLQAGYSKDDRSRLKNRLKQGKLSLNKMEEILIRCGFSVVVEKQWDRL